MGPVSWVGDRSTGEVSSCKDSSTALGLGDCDRDSTPGQGDAADEDGGLANAAASGSPSARKPVKTVSLLKLMAIVPIPTIFRVDVEKYLCVNLWGEFLL